MTAPEGLPLFVREALDGNALDGNAGDGNAGDGNALDGNAGDGNALDGVAGEGNAGPSGSASLAVDAERSLLALEHALGAERGAEKSATEREAPRAEVEAEVEVERVLGRLARTISEPPYRYAPFFARAAELFDLSEDAVIAQLERLRDPKVWRFAGLPGISHVAVEGGPRVQSAEALFVRFKPGVYFPSHRHTGLERVLVLEGSYEDSGGVRHGEGELREWQSGTAHSFKVSRGEPCIFASVVFGRRFDAWPLRALAKLLGR